MSTTVEKDLKKAKTSAQGVESSKTAKKAKKEKVKDAKLDASNKEEIKKAITKEKDLEYNYPADCNDLYKRKSFRRNARTKIKAWAKKILSSKTESTEKETAIKELQAFSKEILTQKGYEKHVAPVLGKSEKKKAK